MRWLLVCVGIYAAMSLVSVVAYGLDKRAAIKGRQRTRERTLHLIDLVGGWPGGLLAQRWFRHKTRDTRFQIWFWLTVALHVVLAGVIIWWRVRLSSA